MGITQAADFALLTMKKQAPLIKYMIFFNCSS